MIDLACARLRDLLDFRVMLRAARASAMRGGELCRPGAAVEQRISDEVNIECVLLCGAAVAFLVPGACASAT
jgi:hypothetical protein